MEGHLESCLSSMIQLGLLLSVCSSLPFFVYEPWLIGLFDISRPERDWRVRQYPHCCYCRSRPWFCEFKELSSTWGGTFSDLVVCRMSSGVLTQNTLLPKQLIGRKGVVVSPASSYHHLICLYVWHSFFIVGVYYNSGHSEYQVAEGSRATDQTIVIGPQGPGFPVQWNPRYGIAAGMCANPDHRETYTLNLDGPRVPATSSGSDGYVVNPKDHQGGFMVCEFIYYVEVGGDYRLGVLMIVFFFLACEF